MTGIAVAFAAWITATVLICSAIADIWKSDHRDQADNPEDGHPGDTQPRATAERSANCSAAQGWLPATLPPTPVTNTLWRPRVSGGRVAGLQAVITVCDAAGWPVRSYSAGVCWPAQEGIA